MSGVWKCI